MIALCHVQFRCNARFAPSAISKLPPKRCAIFCARWERFSRSTMAPAIKTQARSADENITFTIEPSTKNWAHSGNTAEVSVNCGRRPGRKWRFLD